jgi:YHS domain-containing protein
LLAAPPRIQVRSELVLTLRFDPVCAMVISPGRARARADYEGATYYFCSPNCRDRFEQEPSSYLRNAPLAFGPARKGSTGQKLANDDASPLRKVEDLPHIRSGRGGTA